MIGILQIMKRHGMAWRYDKRCKETCRQYYSLNNPDISMIELLPCTKLTKVVGRFCFCEVAHSVWVKNVLIILILEIKVSRFIACASDSLYQVSINTRQVWTMSFNYRKARTFVVCTGLIKVCKDVSPWMIKEHEPWTVLCEVMTAKNKQ